MVNLLEFPQSKATNDWLVSFFSLIYDSAPEYYACAWTNSHYLVEDVDEYASPYQMAINAASMADQVCTMTERNGNAWIEPPASDVEMEGSRKHAKIFESVSATRGCRLNGDAGSPSW